MRILVFGGAIACGGCMATSAPAPQIIPPSPVVVTEPRKPDLFDIARENSERHLAEARRKAGFPPQEDMAGTLRRCEGLIMSHKDKALTCVSQATELLSLSSGESAETVANAAIAGCSERFEDVVRVSVPYCISERRDAERAIGEYKQKLRDDVLARVVAKRAAAKEAPPVIREKEIRI